MIVRKLLFQKETLHTDELGRASAPVTRAAAMAVVQNPFAGVDAEDLSDLFRIATDFTDQDHPFGIRIFFEEFQQINER